MKETEADEPFDCAHVRVAVQEWFDSLQVEGRPYGCLRAGPDREPDFYASADAAITRAVWGENLSKTLSPPMRREWTEYLNTYQSRDDGAYQTYTHHSKLHANGTAVGVLGVLGGEMRYPVRLYEEFDAPEKVVAWLESAIDWSRQWTASHLFWGGMHCFSLSTRATPQWRATVFDWLDAKLDPQTGWWLPNAPSYARPEEPLGGGAHIWPMYQHHGRAFPYPRPLLDSILAMQKTDGSWQTGWSYLDLDALYGLRFVGALAPGYREADIQRAVRKHARLVRSSWQDELQTLFEGHPHPMLAAIGIIGLHRQLRPQVFTDDRAWSDIFSDIRLYQTDAVTRWPD